MGRAFVMSMMVLLGCAAGPQPARQPGMRTLDGMVGVAELESGGRDITVSDQMWHHFADVAKARNALIHGDLDAARRPLNRLAAGRYGSTTPDAWAEPLARMRAEAGKGAAATDIAQGARVVASVAGQCGECHRAQGVHPQLTRKEAAYRPHGREGLSEAMARHVHAAEELWLGLTIPHDPTWQRGAQALARTEPPPPPEPAPLPDAPTWETGDDPPPPPAPAPTPPALDPALVQAIEDIRSLGDEAAVASGVDARQQVYATLIARCGDCHRRMAVEPR